MKSIKYFLIIFSFFLVNVLHLYGFDKAAEQQYLKKKQQKKEEKYKQLFNTAEKFHKNGDQEKAIMVYSYLKFKGYLPEEKFEDVVNQISNYYYKKGLYGISIGYYEDYLKDGKYFPDNFFLEMSKIYEKLGKIDKAKKILEEALTAREQKDEIKIKELAEIDRINNNYKKTRKGVLEMTLTHPLKPYYIKEPMILEITISNFGLSPVKIDKMVKDGVARNLAVSIVKDWSDVITHNKKNAIHPYFMHPALEYSQEFPPVKENDIVKLGPGDEYKIKINLWAYIEMYENTIYKENKPVLDDLDKYFVCVMYGDFYISAKNKKIQVSSEQAFSDAILVSLLKKRN